MFFFKNKDNITLVFQDGTIVTDSNNNFKKYEPLLKNGFWEKIKSIYNITKTILSSEQIHLKDNTAIIDGEEYDKSTSPLFKLIELIHNKGISTDEVNLIRPFLQNIVDNKFIDAKIELFDYLKAMDFEVTADGCFLAYKAVNENLTSVFDGKTQHIIGEYTEESNFDTNRDNYCSRGLHFCSREYLSNYDGKTIILVKVNPIDVVSIPTDCKFQKGRCRKYKTIAVLGTNEAYKHIEDIDEEDNANYDLNLIKYSKTDPIYKKFYEEYCNGSTPEEISARYNYRLDLVKRYIKKGRMVDSYATLN